MPNNKTKKKSVPVKKNEEKYVKTYNPTKSKVGRIILIILVIGMFLAMLLAAIFGMVQVLQNT